MTTTQIVWCLLVFAAAAFVQSVGGFGFTLFGVPLMALAIPLPQAVVAGSIASFVNVVTLSLRTLKHVDWQLARRFNGPALLGMPVGLLVLVVVDESILKVALGAVIVALVVVLLRTRSAAQPRPLVETVAGLASGVLSTSTSTNGPPLVFAAHLRGMQPDAFRATLSFSFAFQGGISIVAFFASGEATRAAVLLALGALPLVGLGQWLGLRVQPRVHGKRFERVVYALLLLSALSVSWSGLFG